MDFLESHKTIFNKSFFHHLLMAKQLYKNAMAIHTSKAFVIFSLMISLLPIEAYEDQNSMIYTQEVMENERMAAIEMAKPVRMIKVAKKGDADFRTVQEAVDSIPQYNLHRVLIYVKRGVYKEKVKINTTKPFITLRGEGAFHTLIDWDDSAHTLRNGIPLGTVASATFTVESDHFIAQDIAFRNSYENQPMAQAVAFSVKGDKSAFYNCHFYGVQDTLFDAVGRHYFFGCYIVGRIDYIFGNARSLYKNCTMQSIGHPDQSGYVVAQKRGSPFENTGYSFVNCIVTGSVPTLLARAWGPYSTVIFAKSLLSKNVKGRGWSHWNDPQRMKTVYFGEYECFGPGATMKFRVSYAKRLTDIEAFPFLDIGFIDGHSWVPRVR